MHSPEPGHSLGVDQLEDSLFPVGPLDCSGTTVLVLEELQQELPQVRSRPLAGLALKRNSVRANLKEKETENAASVLGNSECRITHLGLSNLLFHQGLGVVE